MENSQATFPTQETSEGIIQQWKQNCKVNIYSISGQNFRYKLSKKIEEMRNY